MKAYRWEILTPESVQYETYYNLLQLVRLTGYAMPHHAMAALQRDIAVWKDECGNIVRLA